MEEKLIELLSNEEYVKELAALRDHEKIAGRLNEQGINITASEVKQIIGIIRKKADGELSDDELEQIAGGSVIGLLVALFVGVPAVAATTTVVCHATGVC